MRPLPHFIVHLNCCLPKGTVAISIDFAQDILIRNDLDEVGSVEALAGGIWGFQVREGVR